MHCHITFSICVQCSADLMDKNGKEKKIHAHPPFTQPPLNRILKKPELVGDWNVQKNSIRYRTFPKTLQRQKVHSKSTAYLRRFLKYSKKEKNQKTPSTLEFFLQVGVNLEIIRPSNGIFFSPYMLIRLSQISRQS